MDDNSGRTNNKDPESQSTTNTKFETGAPILPSPNKFQEHSTQALSLWANYTLKLTHPIPLSLMGKGLLAQAVKNKAWSLNDLPTTTKS